MIRILSAAVLIPVFFGGIWFIQTWLLLVVAEGVLLLAFVERPPGRARRACASRPSGAAAKAMAPRSAWACRSNRCWRCALGLGP
jgi:hypothetical protein